jgi:WhiB family redox-sensing transcriptional regulator
VTAGQPRHRSPAAPAPFVARWRELAACRGADLGLFFPGRGESAEPARQVCAGCPVREPCLDYALGNGITHGVWGGLAERDRRALRSRRVGAVRRERDEAIAAAAAAGSSQAVIGRAFGLARTSVNRVPLRRRAGTVMSHSLTGAAHLRPPGHAGRGACGKLTHTGRVWRPADLGSSSEGAACGSDDEQPAR